MASSSHSSAHHINIDIKVWQMILNYFCNGQKETAWAGLRNRRRNTGSANETPKAFAAVILPPPMPTDFCPPLSNNETRSQMKKHEK
jgi:hypothetical protein